YDTFYCGLSTVYHLGGATLATSNPKKTFLNFRNSLLMLTKNLPTNQLVLIIFGRMILDGIAGIQFLAQGKFNHFFAIFKAHFSFYALLIKTIHKRELEIKNNYYKINSIVYAYFVKK